MITINATFIRAFKRSAHLTYMQLWFLTVVEFIKSRFLSTSNARSFCDLSSAIDPHSCTAVSILFPFPPLSLRFNRLLQCRGNASAAFARGVPDFQHPPLLWRKIARVHSSTDTHSARRCSARNTTWDREGEKRRKKIKKKIRAEEIARCLSWRDRAARFFVPPISARAEARR